MVEIEIREGNYFDPDSGGVSFDHPLYERFFYDRPEKVTWSAFEDVKMKRVSPQARFLFHIPVLDVQISGSRSRNRILNYK